MALKITKVLCSSKKYSVKCPYKMTPGYITIHNTANDASAMSEISYMIGNNNQVSYHYAVDDTRAVQGILLNRNAWHAGDGKGTGNMKSIAIEICYSKSGGKRFTAAEKNAAKLTAILLKENGWGISRVKRHKDWSGKDCPHRTIDKGWKRWLNLVQDELDILNGKKKTAAKKSTVKDVKDFKVKIICKSLNVRSGPGADNKLLGTVKKNHVFTIVKTNADGTWGLLKAGPKAGYSWIRLSSDYIKKVA